jgi:hypothetical protein
MLQNLLWLDFYCDDSLAQFLNFKIAVAAQIHELLTALTDKLFKHFAFITYQSRLPVKVIAFATEFA